jgi:hypothetical protein
LFPWWMIAGFLDGTPNYRNDLVLWPHSYII